MERLRRWHPDRLALLSIATLALVLCHGILGGGVLFERDVFLVWHAQIEAFVRCVAAGSWPLWDPWTGFGIPMLANPSAQVLYPPTWLNLLMQPWTYYGLYTVAHLAFTGIGLFLLGVRLGLTRMAALTAAGLWMSSGPLLSLENVWHHFGGAAWMPWVLLSVDAAMRAPRARVALLWGAVLAGQVLAGSPDMSLLSVLLAGAFAAARFERASLVGVANRAGALRLALFGLCAAGLTAGQWLPTLASALESARFALAPEKRAFWALHPLALTQLVLPVSFADLPRTARWAVPLFDLWSPFLRSVYLGLPASILVLAAFLERRPYRRVWTLSGLAALLFALGPHTPFHGMFSTLLPMLQILRYPSKAMTVVALCFALLAGMGFDALRSALPGRLLLGLPLAGAALALPLLVLQVSVDWLATGAWPLLCAATLLLSTWLAGRPGARSAALIAALSVLDLVGAHWAVNPTTRKEFFSYRPEVLKALPQTPFTRLHVWDYVMPVPGALHPAPNRIPVLYEDPPGWPRVVGSAMAMQTYLYPPSAARFGLHGSYDPDLLDLGGHQMSEMNLLTRATAGSPGYARLLALGAVDHVLALHDQGFEDFPRVGNVAGLFSEPIRVFRVPSPLPHAYVVEASRVLAEPAAYRALLDPSFDPSHEVVLAAAEARAGGPQFRGQATLVDARPDRVRLEVEANRSGYLVLVDAHAPGWKVAVDGHDAPLLRANVLFRAVAIAPGRHSVEFRYRPAAALAGVGISALSLVGWAWLSRTTSATAGPSRKPVSSAC